MLYVEDVEKSAELLEDGRLAHSQSRVVSARIVSGQISRFAHLPLSLVWLVSGAAKLFAPVETGDMIMRVVPAVIHLPHVAFLLAFAVAGFELMLGAALCFRKIRVAAASASFIFASVLVGVNYVRLISGISTPCSCLGSWVSLSIPEALAMNAGILGVSVAVCMHNWSIDNEIKK